MEIGKLEVEYVEPSELSGKTVVIKPRKKFYYGEPYSYKVTGVGSNIGNEYSLFLTLFNMFNDKRMAFIEYLFKYMNKNNIINIDKNKVMRELDISKATYYQWIGSGIKEDLLVKVIKNKYMINPQIIINYRKTKNNEIANLVEQYRIYRSKK